MADLEQRISDDEIRAARAVGSTSFKSLPFSAQDVRSEIRRTRSSKRRRIVLGILAVLAIVVVLLACFVFKVPDRLHTVETGSMEPTLAPGQTVLMQDFETPHSNDVVMYRTSSGETQIRRIIACPGEWLGVTDDDQMVLSESAIAEGVSVERESGTTTIIACTYLPERTYFLLGDAEPITSTVLENPDLLTSDEEIQGRIAFKAWPPFSIGPV